MSEMLVWLEEIECHETALVGGKAANLSRLMADYPVPLGFCLTSAAFAQWEAGRNGVIVPPTHQEMLARAYQSLGERCQMAEPRVAVRSSALSEDGQLASFAGQYETYLNITGAEAVVEAVAKVWASAHSLRVQSYRDQRAMPANDLQVAVLIQQLIAADVSVVAFSANPITGNRNEIVINASWGLGESVVGGTVTPDTYIVCKTSLKVLKRQIAHKQRMTVMVADGVQEVPVPRLMWDEAAISTTQAIEIARLARALEERMNWAVDIECTYQAEKLYLLQCRPITTGRPISGSAEKDAPDEAESHPLVPRGMLSARLHASPVQKAIPIPPDFPVKWNKASDAKLLWRRERIHFPASVAPLDFSLRIKGVEAGFNVAALTYGLPFTLRYQHLNTYVYNSRLLRTGESETLTRQAEEGQERLKRVMFALLRLWNEEWLPEIKSHLDYWDAYPLQQASGQALLAHLDETEKRVCRLYEIHFLLFLPMMLAISAFEETYQALFSGSDRFEAYELLGGFGNKTVESGEALWALSRQALACPAIAQILSENKPTEIAHQLTTSAAGAIFWKQVQDYLQAYGQRSNVLQLNYACWLEEPTPVIVRLQQYMLQAEGRNPTAKIKQLAIKREQRLAQVRQQLIAYPQPLVTHVEKLLEAAQISNILSEDHAFWIDCQLHYQVRQVCLEFGRRFAEATLIDHRDDLFYLTLSEVKKVAERQTACQRKILERKALLKQFADYTPPVVLGTMQTMAAPEHLLSQAIVKFFGAPPPISETTDELKGYAGAPGVVQGTAKVIHTFDEARKVKPGDILVTPTTTPPWTPLFVTVAAVVTDTGGILCHTAIVAREYGIPAVVGTGKATKFIEDGQLIEVNGDTGVVRLV
jgi:phosphohistidine swiveling domain-containing protein